MLFPPFLSAVGTEISCITLLTACAVPRTQVIFRFLCPAVGTEISRISFLSTRTIPACLLLRTSCSAMIAEISRISLLTTCAVPYIRNRTSKALSHLTCRICHRLYRVFCHSNHTSHSPQPKTKTCEISYDICSAPAGSCNTVFRSL